MAAPVGAAPREAEEGGEAAVASRAAGVGAAARRALR